MLFCPHLIFYFCVSTSSLFTQRLSQHAEILFMYLYKYVTWYCGCHLVDIDRMPLLAMELEIKYGSHRNGHHRKIDQD